MCIRDSVSSLPFDTQGRCYGTMEFLSGGELIAYVYDINDEQHADYCVSHDRGTTWCAPQKAYFAKSIRNPQMARFGGGYFLHGRSGNLCAERGHFVLYYSNDGIVWDEGRYLRMRGPGAGAYSNNLVVGRRCGHAPHRLLIQASHPYQEHRTNVLHWWIDERRPTTACQTEQGEAARRRADCPIASE